MSSARSASPEPVARQLVIDASAAVKAALGRDGFAVFANRRLVAPSLLWSEAVSALRQLEHRAELTADDVRTAHERLAAAAIDLVPSPDLVAEALVLARTLGWAKTYDAEYLALARRLRVPLVTIDTRLKRGGSQLAEIIGPIEIPEPA